MNLYIAGIKNRISRIRKELKEARQDQHFYGFLLFFGIILIILLINTVHESYPDEFDNILGGWNILHGNPLYSTFFTHHGPVAYIIAAVVEIFSGNSFFRFRIVYAFFLFFFMLFTYFYFRKKFGYLSSRFYLLFLLFVTVGATYFWGHMLLADNISAYFLSPAVGILLLNHLHKKSLTKNDLLFISIMTFLSLLSSLTYFYLVIGVYFFTFVEFFSSNNISYKKMTGYYRPILVFGAPFFLLFLYLVLTGSLFDYFYQNIVFNQKYYIYNYPRAPGETTINPIRFAIIIARTFLVSFSDLSVQMKDFNFYFPFNISLAAANTVFLIYLFVKKRFKLLAFFLFVLIYANGRSNPLTSGERDYQSAVYIVISLFAASFIIYELYDELKNEDEFRKRVIYVVLFLIVFVYSFANFQFLGRKFLDRAYNKYMGKAPLIYDRPEIAPILNTILTKNDYTWIGPFEFEELFYTKEKIASQYQIFNPGMGRSEKIQNGLIQDFEKNKPKLIWFDKGFYILGENPEMYGKPFINYIQTHYSTLYDYRNDGKKYISVKPIDQRTDIEKKLYIRNENLNEIVQKMVNAGIIQEVSAK